MLNKLLEEQIKQQLGSLDNLPDNIRNLLEQISKVYDHFVPVQTASEIKNGKDIERPEEVLSLRSKLRTAYHELQTLFDNIQEVFYSVDMVDYRLLQISKSCETIFGYSVNEFTDNPNLWLEIAIEEDKPIILRSHDAMYAGESFSHEYRVRRKDGSIRWIESRLTPTLDRNGQLVRLDGTSVDITKRKEAETALKDSEVKFRYLIGNTTDAIMIRDADNTIVYCSDSTFGVIGYKPNEVLGKKTLDDIHPEDLDRVLDHRDVVLDNPGKPIKLVYRRMRKDGVYIWCEGTSTNLLHQPEVRGIVVNFRDITERKEAELALRASENKFRFMISHSADAIMIMDNNRKAVYVSESITRVTGYTPDEIVGNPTVEVIHPADRATMLKHWETVDSTRSRPVSVMYRRLHKNGHYIWCEGVGINLIDEPEINGVLINFRDVTERIEAEMALKESNDELKKSNAELDRFVYSVSHDLRAPLTSMSGIVSLAEMETADDTMHQYLDMVKGSIKKLDGFIHDILDYSRNARTGIRKQDVDFNQLLDDISDNLRFMEPGAKVNITRNITGHSYCSDRGRIGIILNNLISNAVRYYNPELNRHWVNIDVSPADKDIVIVVQDNGVGIPADKHMRIFEMFYRVSQKSTGSGLGLYIVKETVEKMDGHISIESEPGKGTTFRITIPNLC
jgi:PAS domain S-box-containing protein